jgi:hypothetical protein
MNDLPAPQQHASVLLQQIERILHSDVDPAKIEQVLALYNRERDRAQLEEFNRAMTDLQSEVFQIAASGHNPTFRTAYPKLHDLVKETVEVRKKHSISIRFGTVLQKTVPVPPIRDGWQRVVCIVSHTSGHWEEHYLDLPPDIQQGARARSPVQAVGSANTYGRRYLFQMVLNLVPGGMPEDDDGRGGRDGPLTPEQIAEIKELSRELGYGEEDIKRADDLRASEYTKTINTLLDQKKRRDERGKGRMPDMPGPGSDDNE